MSIYEPKSATAVQHEDGAWWVHDEFGELDGPYTHADACAVANNINDNAAEEAWQRQQEALMESGGPDDSAYRRDMIHAGRGHLLR